MERALEREGEHHNDPSYDSDAEELPKAFKPKAPPSFSGVSLGECDTWCSRMDNYMSLVDSKCKLSVKNHILLVVNHLDGNIDGVVEEEGEIAEGEGGGR